MTEHSPEARSWFRSRSGLVLLAFLAIGAELGETYARYAATTPAFVPRFWRATPRRV